MKRFKKWFSGALCLALLLGLLPTAALAEGEAGAPTAESGTPLPEGGGVLAPGSYFLSGDLTLTTDLTISGEVTLDLKGHTLTGTGKGSVITVDSGGILTLNDTGGTGKITGGKNTHTEKPWLYGGGVSVSNGKFIMNGGTITGNDKGEKDGAGGVNLILGGSFTMNGGSITNNVGSGLIVNTGSTATISNNSTISGNQSPYSGGGVAILDHGELTMTGGTISNNVTGEYGGGVYINGATFKMSGGSITDNTANEDAGGVMINTGTQEGYIDSTFDMSGGSITGNSAKAKAGGVLLYRNDQGKYSTVFKVSGMVTVTGNHAGTDNVESNVSLYPDKTITAAGLTNGARIGVNRGMAAVVIFRAAGSPDLGTVSDLPFTDITGNNWYNTAVASLWAMQVLVASDAVGDEFAPGQYITKAELQTWLSRYDAYKAGQGGTTDPGSGSDPGSSDDPGSGSDPYPDDIVPETRPDPVPPVSSSSVTKNPDGSTTTTTKNTTTGTVTVTTKNPDGSTSVVETKKDGTVTETVKDAGGNEVKTETKPDGTVTTTEKDAAGNKTSTVANPDGSGETKVDNSDGSTSTTKVDTGGQVKAEVKLSDKAVEAAEGAPVTLPMPELPVTSDRESAPAVTVELPKDAADVTVEIPVKEVTPGTVVVLVNADGTEEVVKTTLTTKNGVAVTVRDGVTVKVVDNSKQFDDVPETHWSSDAVSFASSRELLNGTSADEATFSPDEDMTRAMLMTVLARFDGADTEGGSVWYEKSMEWAVANGVSDGTAPNSSITREQMVVMLYRYAGSPPASGSLDSFADADNVSGYAADAMRWAVDNGIIGGTGDGALSPQGNATRAQVSTVLMRYVQKLAK